MSPAPQPSSAQADYIATQRALADGGRVAVDPVVGTEGALMISYRFGGRRQTRLVLADGYVTQGYSDPHDAGRRGRPGGRR